MGEAVTKEKAANDEELLIRRIVEGDPEEFAVIVRGYQERIYLLIARQVRDQETAKELTQDTFVRAYQALHKFKFECSLSTWLVRIALNMVASHFSSRQFKNSKKAVSLELISNSERTSSTAESSFNVLAIKNAIQSLPQKFREVLVLLALEGKSHEETSAVLNIPPGTVASRMHKAIALLDKKLAGKII